MSTSGTFGEGGELSLATLFAVPGVHSADRRYIPVHRPQVEKAALLVREAGLVEKLTAWRTEDGFDPAKGGRPSDMTDEQVLTLLMILALEGQPLHATLARDLVQFRLTDNALTWLGIVKDDHRWRHTERARYARVWRAVRRTLAVIDPHPDEQRRRRYFYPEHALVLAHRDNALEEVRLERLSLFTNALIWATFEALPAEIRERWDGSVAVDGTHIPLVKRGTSGFGPDNRDAQIEAERLARGRRKGKQPAKAKTSYTPLAERWQDGPMAKRRVSSAPYGGWYTRNHDLVDQPDNKRDTKWALDAQVVFMAHPGPDTPHPNLVLGFNMDKPARKPRQSALRALTNVLTHVVPRNYIIGDRDYFPHALPEEWSIILRKAGYKIVGDLRRDTHGVMGEYGGAVLVDSNWYCPGMPEIHRNATVQLHEVQSKVLRAIKERQGAQRALAALPANSESGPGTRRREIELRLRRCQRAEELAKEELARQEKEWEALLEYRQAYLLRPREAPRENGSQAFKCPASGPGATVKCPLKKEPPRTKGARTAIRPGDLPSHPGKICKNESGLTIPVEASAKYVQALVWQSEEWKDAYGYARAMNEARNGWLKNVQGGSIADSGRRLMRGLAAQWLLIGLMIAAENIRAIEAFLRKADGPRKPRKPRQPRRIRVRWDAEEDESEWTVEGADGPNAPPLAA